MFVRLDRITMTKIWIVFSVLTALGFSISAYGQERDSILPDGRKVRVEILVVPCDCDSLRHDSIALLNNECVDTALYVTIIPSILDVVDSLATVYNVPYQLIYEIGMNESRWPNIYDPDFLIKDGDLQVIDRSFHILYRELGLSGGKTRTNYLICAIYYLRKNYDKYGSWKKARYAYGRGHWRPESQWTKLERSFMNKIDWNKYDTVQGSTNNTQSQD